MLFFCAEKGEGEKTLGFVGNLVMWTLLTVRLPVYIRRCVAVPQQEPQLGPRHCPSSSTRSSCWRHHSSSQRLGHSCRTTCSHSKKTSPLRCGDGWQTFQLLDNVLASSSRLRTHTNWAEECW